MRRNRCNNLTASFASLRTLREIIFLFIHDPSDPSDSSSSRKICVASSRLTDIKGIVRRCFYSGS